MAYLFTSGKFQAFDSSGNPLASGKVYTYAAGTTTPLATYTTQAGTVANANPVILDAAGRADIWLGAAAYRLVVKTSADVVETDTDNIYPLVQQFAVLDGIVSVKDYGAVGDGVTNDTTAINSAKAAALAAGAWLVFPQGDYLYSGTVYAVGAQGWVLNRDFDAVGYNPISQASGQALTILAETPDTTPLDNADSRVGISITMQANGSQHGTGIRINHRNYSDDGNGNTGIYIKAMTDTAASWLAGYHVETRHAATSGGTFGVNIECASYAATGNMYGIVVHNATASTGDTIHDLTGGGLVSNPNAYGIHIVGNNNLDPMGGWVRGINFVQNSMRAAGNCIYVDCDAAVEAVLKTSANVVSATADIYLTGNSLHGIILSGTYTNAALRLADDQYISLRSNNGIKLRYNTGTTSIEASSSGTVRFEVEMDASPRILLNGTAVVVERQTGWTAPTGTNSRATFDTATVTTEQLAQRVKALYVDLVAHGLIGA